MKPSLKKTIVKIILLTISLIFVGFLNNQKVSADDGVVYKGITYTQDLNSIASTKGDNEQIVLSTGNYYLSGDLTLKLGQNIKVEANNTVNLFLYGYLIVAQNQNRSALSMIINQGTLSIYDDLDGEHSSISHSFYDTKKVTISGLNAVYENETDGIYDCISSDKSDKISLIGGGLVGGVSNEGACIYNTGTFSMNGGYIIGCYAGTKGVLYSSGTVTLENFSIRSCVSNSSAVIFGNNTSSIAFVGSNNYIQDCKTYGIGTTCVQSAGIVVMDEGVDFSSNNTALSIPSGLTSASIRVSGNAITIPTCIKTEYDGQKHMLDLTVPGCTIAYFESDLPPTVPTDPTNVGEYDVYVITGSSSYFKLNKAVTISKKQVEIEWRDDDIEYNGQIQYVFAWFYAIDSEAHPVNITIDKIFKNAGTYTATATLAEEDAAYYEIKTGDETKSYTINPKEIEVIWLDAFTYNGKVQTPSAKYKDVDGNEVSLTISTDKEFKDAGKYTYTITSTISSTNYSLSEASRTKEITMDPCTITIDWVKEYYFTNETIEAKASYKDVNGEKVDLCVEFDSGVIFCNTGEYIAHATFIHEDPNYALPFNTAQNLTIKKYVVDIIWSEDDYTYNEAKQVVTAYYIDLLGKKVNLKVSYSEIFQFAGTYTVTANFTLVTNSYALPEDNSKVYTIKQLAVNEPTINDVYVYNGAEQTCVLEGVKTYMSLVDSTKQTKAGEYQLGFLLDSNYKWAEGSDGTVIWTINKATFNTDMLMWNYQKPYTFNSSNIEVKVVGIPQGVVVKKYTNNKQFHVGKYTATVEFDYDKENYNEVSLPALEWEIKFAENKIELSKESFEVTYNGQKVEVPTAESDFGVVTCNYKSEDIINVGVYNLVYEVEATDDYSSARKEITITVNTKKVKEPFVNGIYKYTGLIQQADVKGFDSKYMATEDSLLGKEAGIYTIRYTLNPNYDWATGSDGIVTWEIRNDVVGSKETGIKDKSQIVISANDGIMTDIQMNTAFINEEESSTHKEVVNYNNLPEDIKLLSNEKVSCIYKIELYKEVDGELKEVQPNDISVTGKIIVKLLIPVDVDPQDIKRIIHVHSEDNIKSISIEDVEIMNGYIVLEVSELSEFALITNQSFVSSKTFLYIVIGAGAVLVAVVAGILINKYKNDKAEAERNKGNRYYVDKKKKKR